MPHTRERSARDATVPTGLAVSPQGTLRLETAAFGGAERLPRALATTVARAFRAGLATGLLHLASKELRTALNPSLAFGRELGKLYLTALGARGAADVEEPIPPPVERLSMLLDSLPPLAGAEYVTPETLADTWFAMDEVVRAELAEFDGTVHEYLQARSPAWHAVGRVTFHLAEQKNSAQRPFAFLATYAEDVAASGRVRHLPLGKALTVYRADREQLLRLLRPVHAAAERSPFVKSLADSGELYEPIAWTPEEAHAFLLAIPDCEAAGVLVRVPNWWKGRRPARVQASAQVGAREPAGLGMESVLSFDAALCLDGAKLTAKERQAVLEGARGLRLIRGQWIEVDPERLREALEHFESVAAVAGTDGLSFAEGMRLLAGASPAGETQGSRAEDGPAAVWAGIEAGPWLAEILAEIREPNGAA